MPLSAREASRDDGKTWARIHPPLFSFFPSTLCHGHQHSTQLHLQTRQLGYLVCAQALTSGQSRKSLYFLWHGGVMAGGCFFLPAPTGTYFCFSYCHFLKLLLFFCFLTTSDFMRPATKRLFVLQIKNLSISLNFWMFI